MSKLELLKDKGYRLTKSRVELLELFESNPNKHFTMEDIIANHDKKLNISTLYNNIATFIAENIICEIHINDKKYYEYNHKVHAHFKCLDCNDFFDLKLDDISGVEEKVSNKYNVDITSVDILFSGLCNNCNDAQENDFEQDKEDITFNLVNENEYMLEEREIKKYLSFLQDSTRTNNKSFSLVFIDKDEMKSMNKEFRDKDYVTDVLTFCENEDNYLGDIIICYDKMVEQAKEYEHSEKRELLFLITHGYLHLLGYDHMSVKDEIEMFDFQNKLLNSYGVKR